MNIDRMLVGHTIRGRYKVYDEVGRGGAAIVYLARDIPTGQIVVLKAIHPHLVRERFIGRFEREIKILKRLNSPHIVRIYDSDLNAREKGLSQPLSYLVMEYVPGRTLSSIIQSMGPLQAPGAVAIVRQIALALLHLHEHQVVHRDVKSRNVMITNDGMAKLIDFGVAKNPDFAALTQTEEFTGTLLYASPEQLQDSRDVDIRTDIYSLGIVLFEMLTGANPFPTEGLTSIAERMTADVPRIAEYRGDVPSGIQSLLEGMLAVQPEERFESPQALIQEIDRRFPGVTLSLAFLSISPGPMGEGAEIPPKRENRKGWELVLESGERLLISSPSEIVGRSNAQDTTTPDIDLRSASSELVKTVSRQHCRITASEGGECFVEDLGSRNGTRVNGIPLIPHRVYPLADRDLLQLGGVSMILHVTPEASSSHQE